MRIAQVSPLFESVPPKLYGGTERVVSWLTEELVRQGHEVTLFASGDSNTGARLVPVCERSLRLDEQCHDQLAYIVLGLEKVIQMEQEFDLVHWHIDYIAYPLERRMTTPHVTTLHGRLDIPDLVPIYQEYKEIPVISISNSQRKPLPWVNWQATIHHGLPADLFDFQDQPGTYLAFLGRISPEKGVDNAIEIASRAGIPLKIAAKISTADRAYYEEVIKPLIENHPDVEFLGEISEMEKNGFLGNALALLFPITWPEPFGIVMIESMACGTPIIAFPGGSVTEVMENGASGFIVPNVDGAVKAIDRIASLNRKKVRQVFEKRFTSRHMTENYLKAYKRVIENTPTPLPLDYRRLSNRRAGRLHFPTGLFAG
jgi:glycosyltransferase involved in cell wall biosynthesis